MEVKDIQGNKLIDVPITEGAVKIDELMKQHSISLSWDAIVADVLPLGAYIEYEGVKYTLLAPYKPQQKDEVTYEYKPVFSHPVMRWQHLPFFHYTYSDGDVSSKETDWSLTDNAANFMAAVCAAINEQTGEQWSYAVGGDMKASASLSFSNTDIFSALTSIAGAFETEWWFDYDNKFLNLYKAKHGSEVTLEVGNNIGIPSATQSKSDYATRFYVFGSTRNIDQSYSGSNVNNIVNKRLTLNPAKYPNGYIDIREGLTDSEILVKTLVFDDIYPRSALTISDVRVRMMWRLDDDNNKIQIGTDEFGTPIYDQYAIWYFKIPSLSFSKDMIVSGKALSVHFNSGPLNGREFELTYHDEEKKITVSDDSLLNGGLKPLGEKASDGTSFIVEKGDFEINFIEEGTYIIPAVTGLIPVDGDSVTLFNIIMPEEYKASAYAELEQAALKAISEQEEDKNNYSFDSNPVAFFDNNPNLSIGRMVLYKNGSYTYSTRVIKLETQLDRPFEQKITIGNEQIKGNTQTLKEEVVNANQNIDLLAEMNRSTEQLQMSYMRTQRMLQESVAKSASELSKLGLAVKEENGKKYLESAYDFYSKGGVASGQPSSDTPTPGGGDGSNVTVTPILTSGEKIATIKVNGVDSDIYAPKKPTYVSELENDAKYVTEDTLADTNTAVATLQTAQATLRTDFDNLNNLLNDDTSGVIDTWNEVVDFLEGYKDSEDLASILSGINAAIADRALKTDLTALATTVGGLADTLATEQGYIDTLQGYFVNGVAKKATADALGNVITDTYATKVALNAVDKRVQTLEALGLTLEVKDGVTYVKSKYSFYTMEGLASGEPSSSGGGGGTVGGSNVSFKAELLSGTKIGTITIDNVATNIYAPSALANPYALTFGSKTYDGSAAKTITAADLGALSTGGGTINGLLIINRDPSVIQFKKSGTVLGYLGLSSQGQPFIYDSTGTKTETIYHTGNFNPADYLPLSGGTLNGDLNTASFNSGTDSLGLYLEGVSSIGMRFQYKKADNKYDQILLKDGEFKFNSKIVLREDNYSSYALPLSGGTIEVNSYTGLSVRNTKEALSVIRYRGLINGANTVEGYLGFNGIDSPVYMSTTGNAYNLIHSGNIGKQSVANAQNLKYSDGILCASVNSSGQLLMSQAIVLTNSKSVAVQLNDGSITTALYLQGGTILSLGKGTSSKGCTLGIYGDTYFYNQSGNSRAVIKENGNVLIGATDDSGHKLQVLGNTKITGVLAFSNSTYADMNGYVSVGNGYLSIECTKDRVGYMPISLNPNGGNVLIGTTTDRGHKFAVYGVNTTDSITAKTLNNAVFSIGHIDQGYGLSMWTEGNGHSHIQAGRTDGSGTLYRLSLQRFGGDVLIGNISNGSGKLQVGGDIRATGDISTASYNSGTDSLGLYLEGVSSIGMRFQYKRSDGVYDQLRIKDGIASFTTMLLVGVTSATTDAKLYVAGNFEATGGVASRQASDRRLKENICTISTTDAVSVLRKLNPIFFKWNALATSLDSRNTGDSVGFIADEYEGLIVNSGRDIWEKYRAIDYTKAIPYLAKGWQINADNIEDLRVRVEVLERENRELKQRLNMRA